LIITGKAVKLVVIKPLESLLGLTAYCKTIVPDFECFRLMNISVAQIDGFSSFHRIQDLLQVTPIIVKHVNKLDAEIKIIHVLTHANLLQLDPEVQL
jgi:hypothetical protein